MLNQRIDRELSITENSSLCANLTAPHNGVACVDFYGYIEKRIFIQALDYIQEKFYCLNCCLNNKNNDIKIVSKSKRAQFVELTLEGNNELDIFFEKEINTPFNLFEAPLIRLTLLRCGNDNR